MALIVSLIESKWILPSHLAASAANASRPRSRAMRAWERMQARVDAALQRFIRDVYGPAVRTCLEWRYVTVAVSISLLLVTVAFVSSGRVRQVMVPAFEADTARASVEMPPGTPAAATALAVAQLEASLATLRTEVEAERADDEPPRVEHVLTQVGSLLSLDPRDPPSTTGQSHLGQVTAKLSPAEQRGIQTSDFVDRWRALTPPIPGADEVTFPDEFLTFGDPIAIELRGSDPREVASAVATLEAALARYPGVRDVRNSHVAGKEELHVEVRPAAETFGLSVAEIARQVRHAFFGAEAQRIQRGRDEVKVMVRYPADERRSIADIREMRVRLADGTALPLVSVADVTFSRGAASLRRRDRRRQVSVTADVDTKLANAVEISRELEREVLPALSRTHPGVSWGFRGELMERTDAIDSMLRGFAFTIVAIFILIAIPLRSYLKAVVIMMTIPFGFVGAVIGHALFATPISFLSYMGVMACSGVVVNDSLVLVSFLNRLRAEGHSALEAAALAGQRRFRPILLTSITTFVGLLPIILEGSASSRFVAPMALSLGFGVLVATGFVLLMTPAAMLVVEDVGHAAARWREGLLRAAPPDAPGAET